MVSMNFLEVNIRLRLKLTCGLKIFLTYFFFSLHVTLEARGVYAVILLMNIISFTQLMKNMYRSRCENGGQSESESSAILIKRNKLFISDFIRKLKMSWVLLMLLLLRTHNTVLVAVVIVQERLLGKLLVKEKGLPVRGLALLCWWMGQTVFFQQVGQTGS